VTSEKDFTGRHLRNNHDTKPGAASANCSQSTETECLLEKSLRPPQTEILQEAKRILRKPYVCRCNEEAVRASG